MAEKTNGNQRDRQRPLRVFVSDDERAAIEKKAADTGLSLSAFLRAVALEQRVESVRDHEAILDLLKVMGDLGRLGGLLKLWLSTRSGEGATTEEVRRVLKAIEATQIKLRVKIDLL